MFFLGHMTWAYVWGVIFAGKRSGKTFIPLILTLGILPDIDLFLNRFGVVHHSFTHSFFFWLVVFAPFLIAFRQKSILYLAAVVQHFAFGDFIVGNVMILWPFSSSLFGFNIAMASVLDVVLEVVGLLLAVGIMYFKGDLRRLLSVDRGNVLLLVPFLALLASMLYFAVDYPIAPLVAFSLLQNESLAVILLAHMILAALLAVSITQGLRDSTR